MRSVSAVLTGFCLGLIACGGSGSTTEPPTTLSISVPTTTITSGTSVQATPTVNGSPATGVTWSTSNSAVASVSQAGLITAAVKGTAVITAASSTATGHLTVTVIPGAPAVVTIFSGNGQTGPAGSRLSDPLCTNVKDAAGNLIIGAVVTYTVVTGAGQIAAPTAPATNASGIAISGSWTLGPAVGSQTVIASSPGATPVTFTATAQSVLSITVPTNPIASGTSVQATAILDGSPTTNVTWSSSDPGVASVSTTGSITGILRGAATITATSGSTVGRITLTVIPGAPATVTVYAGNGQSGNAGTMLPDPLCTNVKDAAGNLIIGALVTYTVTTGGGQLSPPTTVPTDAAGIAISGLWTLGSTAGAQTVTASSVGATSVIFTATAR